MRSWITALSHSSPRFVDEKSFVAFVELFNGNAANLRLKVGGLNPHASRGSAC